jgi:hypothetical protein
MTQAIHIFLKDTRHLRYEIAGLVSWTVLFAVAGSETPALGAVLPALTTNVGYVTTRLSTFVFPAAWWYLVARLLHAEALPGDRQFWLTRPYSRSSLFAAKAMFVGAYIVVPFAIAQGAIVVRQGLAVPGTVPGFLWEQVLIIACVLLPAMAIGTLTRSLVQFVPSIAVLPIAFLVFLELSSWGPVGWVRYALALCVALVTGVVVVFLQFKQRRTPVARLIALSGGLAVLATSFLGWRPAFAFQSALGAVPAENVTATLQLPAEVPERRSTNFYGQLQFHFNVTGLAPETPISCHAGEVTAVLPDRTSWRSGRVRVSGTTTLVPNETGCSLWIQATNVLEQVRDSPVDLSAVIDLTVFGPAQVTTIEPRATPRVVAGAGSCASRTYPGIGETRASTYVACTSAFRTPGVLVEFRGDRGQYTPRRPDSYAPFPADLRLDPIASTTATFSGVDYVQVNTRRPVAHLTRTSSLRGVRLTDFEVRLGR